MLTRRRFIQLAGSGLFVPAACAAGAGPLFIRRMGSAVPEYNAYSSTYDGTNDWVVKDSDLTGNADGKVGTISFWMKATVTGSERAIIRATGGGGYACAFYTGSSGGFVVYMKNPANADKVIMTSPATLHNGKWHHVLACWNVAVAGTGRIYFDGVNVANVETYVNDTLNYTQAAWGIGCKEASANLFNGSLSEVYLNFTEYINNPSAFRNSNGKPVSLGLDGKAPSPSGTAPIIYLRNPAGSFGVNSGTGGNFTITGSLDQGSPP